MGNTAIKDKRILISVSMGRCVKNFLLTSVYRDLIKNNRILICGDIVDQSGFKEVFAHSNVEFTSAVGAANILQSQLLGLFVKATTLAGFLTAKREIWLRLWLIRKLLRASNWFEQPTIVACALAYLALRNSDRFRRFIRRRISRNSTAYQLIEKWHPEVVILLTPTSPQDAMLGSAANIRGIPTVLVPSSWDNVVVNGGPLFDPDCVLSWSKNMTRLAGRRWTRNGATVSNVGQLSFDEYRRYTPSPRSDFLKKVGLNQNSERVITFVAATPNIVAKQHCLLRDIADIIIADRRNSLIVRHVPNGGEISKLRDAVSDFPRIGDSVPHPAYSGNLENGYPLGDPIQDYYDLLTYTDLLILGSPSMMMLEGAEFGKPSIMIGFDDNYSTPGIGLVKGGLQVVSSRGKGVVAAYSKEDLATKVEKLLLGSKDSTDELSAITKLWDVPKSNRAEVALRSLGKFFNQINSDGKGSDIAVN
jgi:hypothetical protein